jgi:GT2 family glycosyltransferase
LRDVVEIDSESRIDHDGDVLVIPILLEHDITELSLTNALRFTPANVPVAVFLDDNSRNIDYEKVKYMISQDLNERNVFLLKQKTKSGYAGQCNVAFEVFYKSNLIIMNDDVVVGEEWYSDLQECKEKYSEAATFSFWSNNGGYLSIDIENKKFSGNITETIKELNKILKQIELNNVTVPVAVGHLIWINRVALNIVGKFQFDLYQGYGIENAFSYEASKYGFMNIVVPSFVYHGKSKSGANKNGDLELISDIKINSKYNWHNEIIYEYTHSKYSRIKSIIRFVEAKLRGLSIGIDATMFYWLSTGTNNGFVLLSRHLRKSERVLSVTWIINPKKMVLGSTDIEKIEKLAHENGISILKLNDPGALDKIIDFDFVFRPAQTFEVKEWLRITNKAYMSGVWFLDFISFGSPYYSYSKSHWMEQRKNLIDGLKYTDAIFYLTNHVQEISKTYNTIFNSYKNFTLPIGIELSPIESKFEPEDVKTNEDFICYGASFNHKNRFYLLMVAQKLIELGWKGRIKFVGPRPELNDSHEDEEKLIETDNELKSRYINFGYLEKDDLIREIRSSQLVVFPSISEGFGMVPWESLKYDKLTIISNMSALSEIKPPGAPTISLKNVDDDANLILKYLRQTNLRNSAIQKWKDHAKKYRWNDIIEKFIDDIFALISEGPTKIFRDGQNLELPRIERILATISPRQYILVKIRNKLPQNLDSSVLIRKISNKTNMFHRTTLLVFKILKYIYRKII